MKKLLPLFVTLGIIVAVAALAWWKLSGTGGTSVSLSEVGLVAEAVNPTGEVVRIRAGIEEPVTDHMLLAAGDAIRTGMRSEVSLEFFAGSRVAVNAESEVLIKTANVEQNDARVQHVALELRGGKMWARVLKLLDLDSSFTVQANTTIATVRGTAFAVTYNAGAAWSSRRYDLFDGVLGMDGTSDGDLVAGFTYSDGAGYVPENGFLAQTQPTPDATRNDPWIQRQLEADKEFIQRVLPIREQLGDTERYDDVGNETAADASSAAPTNGGTFDRIEVELEQEGEASPILAPGETLAFRAYAVYAQYPMARREEVTDKVRLAFSSPYLRLVRPGAIEVARDATGPAMIVARYNDGTEEHSAAFDVFLGEMPDIQIDTQTQLMINGVPVGR